MTKGPNTMTRGTSTQDMGDETSLENYTAQRNQNPVAREKSVQEDTVKIKEDTFGYSKLKSEQPGNSSKRDYEIYLDGYSEKSGQGMNPPAYARFEETHNRRIENLNQEHNVLINRKPLHLDAPTYELEKFQKNALLILNQKEFEIPRGGTDEDRDLLESTFAKFGFEVTKENDKNKKEIMKILNEFTSADFTDYGCVIIVVLTHGADSGFIYAKDDRYNELEIITRLHAENNPSLITKPRIVIIQACRGKGSSKEVPVGEQARHLIDKVPDMWSSYTLPAESDILVIHSSYRGTSSYRLWFIRILCDYINKHSSTIDFETMLRDVKKDIACREKSFSDWNGIFKQIPVTTSTLIRKLYFKKFGDQPADVVSSSQHQPRVMDSPSIISTSKYMDTSISCFCAKDHFIYIKKCLLYYMEKNPEDKRGTNYLKLSDQLNKDEEAKILTAQIICDYLKQNVGSDPFFKCLYFYKY